MTAPPCCSRCRPINRPFIHAFLAKREHTELMKDVPVFLITAEDLGLRGALALAIA